ncbi:MAG TPA: NUDIX domain-containing protein [Mycobacteriales bacterium]|nr:NUDIX domain-containing protein [Mycobacteriales bacterium]
MRDASGEDTPRSRVLGGRQVYGDGRVKLDLLDVEQPGGPRTEQVVVRLPRVALGVVLDEQERVLLRWRHRFVSDTFGWELPSSEVEPDEQAAVTAVRAVLGDTGWRPASPMVHLMTCAPVADRVDRPHELFLAEGADHVGGVEPPPRVDWIPLATVPDLARQGEITDCGSLIGLLYTLALRAKRA